MTWHTTLLVYVACMLVFILNLVDQIRENPEDEPLIEMVRHVWLVRVVMTVVTLGMSVIWPWFAFKAWIRWIGKGAERLSKRLHAHIDRLEAERSRNG